MGERAIVGVVVGIALIIGGAFAGVMAVAYVGLAMAVVCGLIVI